MLLRSLAAALVVFTRIPVKLKLETEDFRRGVWHLPLLAWFYTLLQAILIVVLPWGPQAGLTHFFLLALPILMGGALHEDGWGDFCDAIGAGNDREKRLAIMKDPRMGTFGVLGLVGLISLQWLCLQAIDPQRLILALLLAQVSARGLALSLIVGLPYVAQSSSRAAAYLPQPGWQRGFLYAMIWVIASWCFLPQLWMLPLLGLGMGLVYALLRRYLWLHFEGYTGDCLGASIKLGETLILVLATWLWPRI